MKKGLFIVIEGGDGCGKTSVINGLKQTYKQATFLREPGGTEFGEKVRDLIMNCAEINKTTEMYLFSASRSELVQKVIIPKLNTGELIICDRFVYSSYAYQGAGAMLGEENVKMVNSFALNGIKPDLVIYLKVQKSFRTGNENRLDERNADENMRIYASYDKMAQQEDNFYVLNVLDKTPEEVLSEVASQIDNKILQIKKISKTSK